MLDIGGVGEVVAGLEMAENFVFFILYFLPTYETFEWLQIFYSLVHTAVPGLVVLPSGGVFPGYVNPQGGPAGVASLTDLTTDLGADRLGLHVAQDLILGSLFLPLVLVGVHQVDVDDQFGLLLEGLPAVEGADKRVRVLQFRGGVVVGLHLLDVVLVHLDPVAELHVLLQLQAESTADLASLQPRHLLPAVELGDVDLVHLQVDLVDPSQVLLLPLHFPLTECALEQLHVVVTDCDGMVGIIEGSVLGPGSVLLPGHAMDRLHVGRHDVPGPLHALLSLTQSALELAAGDLGVPVGAQVLLECDPVHSCVTHETGGLVELAITDLTLVLATVQFVVINVSDDRLQGLAWLGLVLQSEMDDEVAIFLEYFITEVAFKSCTERKLSKLAPGRFFLLLLLLVFQNS